MSTHAEQQLMVIHGSLHGKESRSLASKFNSGRFDKDMKWSAERQFAIQIIEKNEKLQVCTPESIANSLLDASFSGLSLSPTLCHGYLIPYGKTCSFSAGYRGLMALAFKAGTVKSIQVNLVFQNDPTFRVWTDERGRHIQHEENARGQPGEVTHAYVICNLTAGGPPIIEVMGRKDLDAVRAASQRRNKAGGAVWKVWPHEMMRKSVIRRASKFWPKDSGGIIEHMMQVSDTHDGIDFELDPDEAPPEAELCMSTDMYTELFDLLTDRGIDPTAAPEWLRRWAQSKGYATIEDTPARLFDEAKSGLTKVLNDRSAATQNSQNA